MSPAAFLNRIRRPVPHRGTSLAPALLVLTLLLALLAGARPADAQILEVWPAHTSPGLLTYFALITDGRYSQVELHYAIGGVEQTVLLPTDSCDGPGGACYLSYTLPATADLGTACFKRSGDSPDTPCAPFAVVAGPVLAISSLSPASATAGGPSFTLTITGWGFSDYAPTVWFDDTFIEPIDILVSSDTQMQVTIPADLIATAGSKTVKVEGLWALDPTATFPVTPLSLQAALGLGPLVQDGPDVLAPISWDHSVTNGTIDCGTVPSQTYATATAPCRYSTPGTFPVTGAYWDGSATQHPEPIQVVVPALPPAAAGLQVTLADGATSTLDENGTVPIARMNQPSVYPVPVQLTLTLEPPAPGPIGIADPLDLSTSRIRIRPVAQGSDLTAGPSPDESRISLQAGSDAWHLGASADLTRFTFNGLDPAHWRQRFVLDGRTLTGLSVSAEVYLDGPVGDGSQIAFTVSRLNPIYPYSPTTYVYRLSGIAAGVPGEPVAQTWTITGDNENRPPVTVQNAAFNATFLTPGHKTITLDAHGPFSGSKPWSETIDVPAAPAVDPIAFYVTPPQFNRPPATYRFAPNYPVLAPGERVTGDPTWTVDGQPAGTSPVLYSTFTTSGAHTVSVTALTSLPRLISGDTAIVIAVNQTPTASIDCSRSFLDRSVGNWVVSCRAANLVDPDGRVRALLWKLPQLPYEKAGSTQFNKAFAAPQLVQVQLLLTDDSGETAMIEATVDLATLH